MLGELTEALWALSFLEAENSCKSFAVVKTERINLSINYASFQLEKWCKSNPKPAKNTMK